MVITVLGRDASLARMPGQVSLHPRGCSPRIDMAMPGPTSPASGAAGQRWRPADRTQKCGLLTSVVITVLGRDVSPDRTPGQVSLHPRRRNSKNDMALPALTSQTKSLPGPPAWPNGHRRNGLLTGVVITVLGRDVSPARMPGQGSLHPRRRNSKTDTALPGPTAHAATSQHRSLFARPTGCPSADR